MFIPERNQIVDVPTLPVDREVWIWMWLRVSPVVRY